MLEIFHNFSLNNKIDALNTESIQNIFTEPSVKTFGLIGIIYLGLLWLSVIIWVTRDAINRSNSLLFQVFAILINIIFPILGILLYLIIRPGKTVMERYYEDLEHRLILESIEENETAGNQKHEIKKHKIFKKNRKNP